MEDLEYGVGYELLASERRSQRKASYRSVVIETLDKVYN